MWDDCSAFIYTLFNILEKEIKMLPCEAAEHPHWLLSKDSELQGIVQNIVSPVSSYIILYLYRFLATAL